MEIIILIILAAVLLFMYIAYKHNELIQESKKLAEKNQYIESGTGKIREFPVGSYFSNTNNKLNSFYNSTPMSLLLELEQQGYTFMFDPNEDTPSYQHKEPIAFYKRNGMYTAVYSENEVDRLDSDCIKYIRLIKKQKETTINEEDSHLRNGNIDEESNLLNVGERWKHLSSDDRLALLDVQCYWVRKAKGTPFYTKALSNLIVIGVNLGFTEEFIEERIDSDSLEKNLHLKAAFYY